MPLHEEKLNQTDEKELAHFKHFKHAQKSNSGLMVESHLSLIQSNLVQQLNIRVLNEEEKYVYLVKNLRGQTELV